MKTEEIKKVYCIFHYAPDKEPSWYDDNDMPITYDTKKEAVGEILEVFLEHICQIQRDERDIEDGIGYGDWIEQVDLYEDGTIVDSDSNVYGKRES